MDQPADNRLATLHASTRKRMHDQDQIFFVARISFKSNKTTQFRVFSSLCVLSQSL
ncbi:hypothetical protein SynROS8604_02021 [Synechococcus sp. ROS8604]|nr:hypothetical protein SynROS8604_02021 [Synechococcus sp. ROS8604]